MKGKIIGMILISILIISGCSLTKVPEETTTDGPIEAENAIKIEVQDSDFSKAVLNLENMEWGELDTDENKMIFSFLIVNYGDSEGKNITVECRGISFDDEEIFKEVGEVQSVASNSYEYREVIFSKPNSNTDFYETIGECKINSCEDCVILRDLLDD